MREMEKQKGERGEQGEPGEPGKGTEGGAGGIGGRGGAGGTTGGVGGQGGVGGRAGPQGPQGDRGPTNHLAVVGYVILVLAVAFALWSISRERSNNIQRLNKINLAQCMSGDRLRKLDLEDERASLAESQAYLREHPQGAPGIPRDLIERGIERAKAKIKQLEQPFCPSSPTIE
jgi:hypothetical protein